MSAVLQPWHLLLLALAGWVNREQQRIIEYLITENQVLKEKLGKKRILLNDDQRRRLAVKGKILGRKVLEEIAKGLDMDPDSAMKSTEYLMTLSCMPGSFAYRWFTSDARPRTAADATLRSLRIREFAAVHGRH